MANLATLRSRVSKKLGLDETASGDEETLVTGWLNDAVLDVLVETHVRVARDSSVALTADVADYELSSTILAIHNITDSDGIPLQRVTEEEINQYRRASASATSVMRYAVSGSNLLMLWPTPSTAATLSIYYVPRPTAMSSGTHDPSDTTYGGIPAEWHKALEFYALWQAADYDDDVTSAQGDRYYGQYQLWINKIRKHTRLKGGRRQPSLRLGRRESMISNDPSMT